MARLLGRLLDGSEPASTPQDAPDIQDRLTFFNFDQITPRKVKWILREADSAGRINALLLLYEDMEVSDTHYGALVEKLHSTIGGMPLRFQRKEARTQRGKDIADEYLEYAREVRRRLDTSELSKEFADAHIKGAKGFLINWELIDLPFERTMWVPQDVQNIDPINLREDVDPQSDTYRELEVNLSAPENWVPQSQLPDDSTLFLTRGQTKGKYGRKGVARTVLPWYVGLRFVQSWWVQFIERHGEPIRVGKYSRTSKKQERLKMKEFLQTVGRRGYGLFPQGMEVELLRGTQTGEINTYEDFLEKGHEEYNLAISGSTNAASEENEQLPPIAPHVLNDVSALAARGWKKLIKKGLRINYGDSYRSDLLPKTDLILLNSKNARERARAAQVASQMGVPIPTSHIYEEVLGIEKPTDGTESVVHSQLFALGEDDMPQPDDAAQGSNNAEGAVDGEGGAMEDNDPESTDEQDMSESPSDEERRNAD